MPVTFSGNSIITGQVIISQGVAPPSPPTPATGTVTESGGVITGVTVTDGGTGYVFPPYVFFVDSTGTGGTGTATISGGSVTGVTIDTDGTGYSSNVEIIFSPPGAQIFTASDETGDNAFGANVAVNGDGSIMVAGAHGADGYDGAVYIYTGTTWQTEQKVTQTGYNSYFGWSVGISADGSTIIAGAVNGFSNPAPVDQTGRISVFQGGGDTWSEVAILNSKAETGNGVYIGYAIDLTSDGDIIVAGAPSQNAIYVWHSDNSPWGDFVQIDDPNGTGNEFGSSVAISADGEVIVVGARVGDSVPQVVSGNASVLRESFPGSRTWNQVDLLYATDPDPFNYDPYIYFGQSVDCSSDASTIVVGATNFFDSGGFQSGAAFVFEEGPPNTWSEVQVLTPASPVPDNYIFGGSVSISDDGSKITMSAGYPGYDYGGPNETDEVGAVYVLTRTGASWTNGYTTELFQPWEVRVGTLMGGYSNYRQFRNGCAISGDGNYLAAGAAEWNQVGAQSGTAYIFPLD
jgi:hypothetical protein